VGDLAILAVVLALGSIISGWFDELSIPAALEWFNPFSVSGRTNLTFQLLYYFAHGGTPMLADYAAVVGWICLLLLLGSSALLLGRRGRPHYPGLESGVGDGNRTRNVRSHSPVLCRLSYSHHLPLIIATADDGERQTE